MKFMIYMYLYLDDEPFTPSTSDPFTPSTSAPSTSALLDSSSTPRHRKRKSSMSDKLTDKLTAEIERLEAKQQKDAEEIARLKLKGQRKKY
jgi:hypothetical protein